jgi:hypothetical protein
LVESALVESILADPVLVDSALDKTLPNLVTLHIHKSFISVY